MSKNSSSLRNIYRDYFPIGTAVNYESLMKHKEFIGKHFNSITSENELKFISTHPEEEVFCFDKFDEFIRLAEAHKMLVRGHTLIWHDQTPDWVFENKQGKSASRELVLERMKTYINSIVSRYKDKVYCWDVVNEAIDDSDDNFFRNTKWFSIIGEDYIDKAFQYAHEADPNTLLFYNDFNYVIKSKRDKIYELLKGMRDREVPIHGVGFQGHYGLYFPDSSEIRRSIEKFANLGLKIQITEMDISVFDWNDRRCDIKKPTTEMLKMQAKRYEEIFEIFREYKEVISGVTFWGLADDYTWLDDFPVKGRKDWPLLFDENLLPKPAFKAITSFRETILL